VQAATEELAAEEDCLRAAKDSAAAAAATAAALGDCLQETLASVKAAACRRQLHEGSHIATSQSHGAPLLHPHVESTVNPPAAPCDDSLLNQQLPPGSPGSPPHVSPLPVLSSSDGQRRSRSPVLRLSQDSVIEATAPLPVVPCPPAVPSQTPRGGDDSPPRRSLLPKLSRLPLASMLPDTNVAPLLLQYPPRMPSRLLPPGGAQQDRPKLPLQRAAVKAPRAPTASTRDGRARVPVDLPKKGVHPPKLLHTSTVSAAPPTSSQAAAPVTPQAGFSLHRYMHPAVVGQMLNDGPALPPAAEAGMKRPRC
jgi:hypothetical protein